MKKAIIILIAILMLTTVAKANTLFTDQTEYNIEKNNTFKVTLYANLTIDSYGVFLYELTWDPTIITLQSTVNPTNWEVKYSSQGGIETDKISYVNWWKAGHNETGLLPILELNFKAIKKGTTNLQFGRTTNIYSHTFNEQADIFELICTNATVTVKDSSSSNGGSGNSGGGTVTPPPPINQNPVAIIDQPNETYVNTTVNFTANQSYDPDGTLVAYLWDFGDDAISTNETTNHVYIRPNVYAVTLTVTDNDGATNTASKYITVLEMPQINDTQPPTNDTQPPTNDTQPPINQTDPPTNDTNITKPKDDGFSIFIIPVFIAVAILCIVFYYMYKKSGEDIE